MAINTVSYHACDACQRPITEARSGIVFTENPDVVGGPFDPHVARDKIKTGLFSKDQYGYSGKGHPEFHTACLCKGCFLAKLPQDWVTDETERLRREVKELRAEANNARPAYDEPHQEYQGGRGATGRPLLTLAAPTGVVAPLASGSSWSS